MKPEYEPLGEVWMILRDRKKLATIMVVQDISQRQLARAAGWRSHSYLGRLLRGEAKTLDPESAVRIAQRLGIPMDELFVTKVSTDTRQHDQGRRTIA